MAESICQHITLTYTTSMLTNNDYTLYNYALKAITQAIIDTKTGWTPDPEFLNMSTGEYNPAYEANPNVEADKYSCINLSHNSGHKIQLCCGSQIPCSEEYHYSIYSNVTTVPQTTLQGFTITYINNKTDKTLNAPSIEEGATIATITKNQDFYTLDLGTPIYNFSDVYVSCSFDGNQIAVIFANNSISSDDYLRPIYYRGLIAGEICKPIIYPSGDFHPLTNIAYTVIDPYKDTNYVTAFSLLLDKQEIFISGTYTTTSPHKTYFNSILRPVVSGAAWSFDKAISSVVTTRGVEQTIISPGIFYVGGGEIADFKVVEGSGIKGYLDTQYLGFCYNYTLPTEQDPVLADGYMLQDGEYIYINKMVLNWSKQNSQDKNPFFYRNLLHTEILDLSNFRTAVKHYYQIDGVTKAFYPKINSDIYLTVYDPAAGKTYSLGKAVWMQDSVNNETYCKWNNFAGAFPDTDNSHGLCLVLVDGEQSAYAELRAGGTSSWATSGIKFYVSYEERTNPYSWHMTSYDFSYNFGHEYSAEMNLPPFLNFGCLLSDPASAITFFLDDFDQAIDTGKPVMLSIGNVGTVVTEQQRLFNIRNTFMNTTWMGSSFLVTDSAIHASQFAWIDDSNKIAISRFDRENSSPYYIFVGVDSPLAQSSNTNDLIVYFNVNAAWY